MLVLGAWRFDEDYVQLFCLGLLYSRTGKTWKLWCFLSLSLMTTPEIIVTMTWRVQAVNLNGIATNMNGESRTNWMRTPQDPPKWMPKHNWKQSAKLVTCQRLPKMTINKRNELFHGHATENNKSHESELIFLCTWLENANFFTSQLNWEKDFINHYWWTQLKYKKKLQVGKQNLRNQIKLPYVGGNATFKWIFPLPSIRQHSSNNVKFAKARD